MAQLSNFRLLAPSLSYRLLFKPRPPSFFAPLASSSSSSSSSRRPRSVPYQPFRHLGRRNSSSSRESKGRDKGAEMEETESIGFNKRRAEGKDNSGLPKKNLQLKVRKLNPVNTISYVQVH